MYVFYVSELNQSQQMRCLVFCKFYSFEQQERCASQDHERPKILTGSYLKTKLKPSDGAALGNNINALRKMYVTIVDPGVVRYK
ncbi:hypothetical protein L1887_26689 [Cichorium endivia]|nr:hypothetical protein L1887_26689 [Cichorium endivia]